jgi:hypothetical protein
MNPWKSSKAPFDRVLQFNTFQTKLRGWDSNPRPIGYTLPNTFVLEWTISSPFSQTERGASSRHSGGATPL